MPSERGAMTEGRTVSAREVRQAVRGVMAAFPKGTRFAGCETEIVAGAIKVKVTVAPDSVQAGEREARLHDIRQAIGEKARARP